MKNEIIQWTVNNAVELFGVLSALVYIYLEIKQRWTMWVVGFVSSAVYVLIFFHARLYATMSLNIYYVLMAIYGLYCWRFSTSTAHENEISRITRKQIITLSIIAAILFVIVSFIQHKYTDSPAPYYDSIIAILSIIATWMVAKKIIEHWYLWIFVNFLSVGLYIHQALYLTALLFTVYGIMSVVGLMEWKRTLTKEKKI